jgi:mycothiol synthase
VISPPAVPSLPAVPGGVVARPLTDDDLDAVAQLQAAAEKVDDTGEHWSTEDLADFWRGGLVDLPRDGVAVSTPDGELVGWATAIAPPTFRGAFRVDLEGRVHPGWRGRGVGRALLRWQLARGAQVHAERHPEVPGKLVVPVFGGMDSLQRLVHRAGLSQDRWYFAMERPLSDLPPVPAVDGVRFEPFDRARDDEVRRAHNASFTEHDGSSERDPESWQAWFTGQRSFRPDLSVLAIEGDAVVAYVLAYVYESDTAATGVRQTHFGQIGVLPHARGRGLAKATIAAALRAGAASDCHQAGLEVDSENGTGALGLYEALGFTPRRTQARWVLALPQGGAGAAD